jgi:hypothetical protein
MRSNIGRSDCDDALAVHSAEVAVALRGRLGAMVANLAATRIVFIAMWIVPWRAGTATKAAAIAVPAVWTADDFQTVAIVWISTVRRSIAVIANDGLPR